MLLFEPLDIDVNPEARSVGFGWRTSIAPGEENPQIERYMRRVLTGRYYLSSRWRFETEGALPRFLELLKKRKLLVKSIRINRMLHWLNATFPLRGTVLIIRHPCAVIASRIEKRGADRLNAHGSTPAEQAAMAPLSESLRERFAPVLDRIETRAEILAVQWCLDHYILFEEHAPSDTYPWVLVPYESLVTDRLQELERVVDALGGRVPPAMHRRFNSNVASETASKSLATDRLEQQLSKWKNKLAPRQIDDILGIVEEFGLDFYTSDPEPEYDRLLQLQRTDAIPAAHAT